MARINGQPAAAPSAARRPRAGASSAARAKGSRPPAAPPAAPDLPVTALTALKPDAHNPRRRTPRGRELIAHSLRTLGAARSIVIDEDDIVRVGNGTVEAAAAVGITNVRIVEADGKELIAVRRRGLTEAEKRALSAADNRTAELAEWNPTEVMALPEAGVTLAPYWTPEEQTELASRAGVATVMGLAEGDHEDDDDAGAGPPTDYQQFTCALTLEQERIVRAALRAARTVYQVDTTGNALSAAMQAWAKQHRPEALE